MVAVSGLGGEWKMVWSSTALSMIMYQDIQNVVSWQNTGLVNWLLLYWEREKQSLGRTGMCTTIKPRSLQLSRDLLQDL